MIIPILRRTNLASCPPPPVCHYNPSPMPVIYAEPAFDDLTPPKLDLLVFGPHPDDAEIGCGGILLKLAARGFACGVCDLTRGEMGTGGDVAVREVESQAAAAALQLRVRENLA